MTYFSCTHELIRTEMSVMIMIAATLLLLLERLHTGLLCGSEVVSPVGNVETGEGPGKHHSRYHIYSLGARVEMKPELCSQDRPDLVGWSFPHESGDQGGEQDGFRRSRTILTSLPSFLLIAVLSEILIYSLFIDLLELSFYCWKTNSHLFYIQSSRRRKSSEKKHTFCLLF